MIKTQWRLWHKCKFNIIWEMEYKKTNEWWFFFFYLEPNKSRVVGTSALMNIQSGAVHNTSTTMQMNSFNVHSVVDHAWKHLANVSVGNISELQVHRRIGERRGWKNDSCFTVFSGKEEKGHPLSAISLWDCGVVFRRNDFKRFTCIQSKWSHSSFFLWLVSLCT